MSEADKHATLFDIGEPNATGGKHLTRPEHPVWTEHKALLIRRYMKLFVMVTKHGTYIDGFTGPQYPDKPEMWAAKLVLENAPKFLRHFHLFETDRRKYAQLEELVGQQPDVKGRTIAISPTDCNVGIRDLLAAGSIAQKEATFCLLDQHTTECEWTTVKALAEYKRTGTKIELFYFLANSWLARALHNTKDEDRLRRWWGSDGWRCLLDMHAHDRAALLVKRFEQELGYRFATAYPIYDRSEGATVMYFMVHATDHDAAPALMSRAYRHIHGPEPSWTEVQSPLFGSTWLLQTDETGKVRATCARCLALSSIMPPQIAVDELTRTGWSAMPSADWLCPECQGKPLGPAPRRPKSRKAGTKRNR